MNWDEFLRRAIRFHNWRWGLCIWTIILLTLGWQFWGAIPPQRWDATRPYRVAYIAATVGPLLIMATWVVAGLLQDVFGRRPPINDQSTDE